LEDNASVEIPMEDTKKPTIVLMLAEEIIEKSVVVHGLTLFGVLEL